jgi:hypothetical protein
MKSKAFMMMIPLLIGLAFATNAQAKSHKIRMKMTGCLEKGAEPDTYVLHDITKAYTRRNTTGQEPLMLARSEGYVFKAKGDVDDLQNHIGQRVSITGWAQGSDINYKEDSESYDRCGNSTSAMVSPSATPAISEFTVAKVREKSGACR